MEYDYRPMAVNLFGRDVASLDVPAFLAASRAVYAGLALAWLALLFKVRRAWWLLAGAVLANAYAWGVTNSPLLRLYALGPSRDRVSNVAFCEVVAAGNSPLHTWQVGQLHFEPFWGLLVAALSGFDPERVLTLYPFFALLTVAGFTLALYYGLRPMADGVGPAAEDLPWSAWERALVAGFATLLCASPLDFTGVYRAPWSMMFLLKPNHAVGLILFPLVLSCFVRIRSSGGRIGTGLLLHFLGWAFILHMAYVAVGLAVFAASSLLARRPDARRDIADVFGVIGVNALIVSPYVVMLLVGYPFLVPNPVQIINPLSPHLLETTARSGWLFALGLWGAAVAHRRGDRLGRAWAAQVAGGYLIWACYLLLSPFQMARERDEIFNWLRFLTAASAGVGAWDLARRVARWSARPWPAAARAAGVALVALPWTLPYWWDPVRMDLYFSGSLRPLPDSIRIPTDFLRQHTERGAVVVADHDFARWVAALGARRVLLGDHLHSPKDRPAREALEKQLVDGSDPDSSSAAAARSGIRYLVATPELVAQHGATLAALERRPDLRLAHLFGDAAAQYVAVFELVPKGR